MFNAQHVGATAVVTSHILFVAQTYYESNSAKPVYELVYFSLKNPVGRFSAH